MRFAEMSPGFAKQIVGWTYPVPYALYNHPPDQRGTVMQDLLDPTLGYEAILDDQGDLVAFWCCGADARVHGGDYTVDALDLGVGLRPNLTGQGRGRGLVRAVVDRAKSLRERRLMRVTIARFNKRALRVWRQAGFVEAGAFHRPLDGLEFGLLLRQP